MNRPLILAIAGGTASGKSTLADNIAAVLGDEVLSISHDIYYKTVPEPLRHSPRRAFEYNYDHPDALNTALLVEHLHELREGRSVMLPRYNYETSMAEQDVTLVTPRRVILVDGILILSDPDLRSLFDFSVFVEAPDDIRLVRRIRRDTTVRGHALDYVLTLYVNSVKPMHDQFVAPSASYANIVLDGTRPIEGLVMTVLEHIRPRMW